MKTKRLRYLPLLIIGAASLVGSPLSVTTAVHSKPDATSPAITYLKAGTEPVAAPSSLSTTPTGWMAIELPGPFEGYAENKDLTKTLDLKPGAPIRLAPKADATILTLAEKDEKISITGLRGKWTQVSLEKKLTAFIQVNTPSARPPPPMPPAQVPMSVAPVAPGIYGLATPGQATNMVNLGDGGSATLPRQFAGRFVSTRRPFTPRRPFDYALNDEAGRRYAYLDVSQLLLTEQIENYIEHNVVVFGAARNTGETRDIVIKVETLQLK